jgi:hypothetical protein
MCEGILCCREMIPFISGKVVPAVVNRGDIPICDVVI